MAKSNVVMLDVNAPIFITYPFMALKISNALVNTHIKLTMLQREIVKIVHVKVSVPLGLAPVDKNSMTTRLSHKLNKSNRQKGKLLVLTLEE